MRSGSERGFGFSGLEYFGPREYWNIFRQRKWLIITITLLVATVTSAVVRYIPNVYRATTVILVDPRKVPDSVVMSTVTTGIGDRIATLRQQVMSSTRLEQIITSMNLYSEARARNRSMDEIVEGMRKDVEVEIMANGGERGMGAFNISFKSRDPKKAADVANRLAAVFIEENTKAREQQVAGTAEFIDRELQDANTNLRAKEDQIREIKTRYASSLPESQLAHVQAINSAQLELRSEMDSIARAQQQKVYLQTAPQPASRSDAAAIDTLENDLAKQEADLQVLRTRYSSDHPDVKRQEIQVAELRQRVGAARKAGRPSGSGTPISAQRPIEAQLSLLDDEIAKHQKRQDELRRDIAAHQQKIDQMPVLEQQLSAVMRDYETARDHYKTLLDRKFAADMSSNLETYQKAERFVVLDAAQPPQQPYRPNRMLLNAAGFAIGFGLSVLLAIFLELNDPTVKTESEALAYVQAPVLAELPWVPTKHQRRKSYRRTFVGLLANGALVAVYVCVNLLVKR